MLPSCSSLKMPTIPTGKNKIKPNQGSHFSQTSNTQPQNLGLDECHWDAGSSPNVVPLALKQDRYKVP